MTQSMDRRTFIKTSGRIFSGLFVSRWIASSEAAQPKKPNVLFIAVDDLNDWVGCLGGHPQTKTPNLDRLAAKGVLFTSAHCAAPACNPSRIALMSGIKPSTSGHYLNEQDWHKNSKLNDCVRLQQHFRNQGYRAIASGKIYHGGCNDPQGWDEYWPDGIKDKPNDPLPPRKNLNGLGKAHFDWGPLENEASEMGDYQVASWVMEQLQKEYDKPLFLGCGFFRPHLPWYVPQQYFDRFPLDQIILPTIKENDLDDVPAAGVRMAGPNGDHKAVIDHDQWRQAVQGYLASIHFMDEQLGRVIAALEKRTDQDNWIIVLWSDHGWHLGEKLHWRKFALWEEATHNVMLWVAPGVTRPNQRCDEPVNLIDIYPTLVELCGLESPTQLEGVSLLPQLKDVTVKREFPSLTTHGFKNHSLRGKEWRYIRYQDGGEELYDREKDPNEWTNLAGKKDYGWVMAKLRSYLPVSDAPSMPPLKRG